MAQNRILADKVDVGEIDERLTLRCDRDGCDGHVDLSQLQSATQAIKGKVVVLDLQAKPPANLIHQRDVEAIDLEMVLVEFERRIVGGCADDDLARRLDAFPGTGGFVWRLGGLRRCCGDRGRLYVIPRPQQHNGGDDTDPDQDQADQYSDNDLDNVGHFCSSFFFWCIISLNTRSLATLRLGGSSVDAPIPNEGPGMRSVVAVASFL